MKKIVSYIFCLLFFLNLIQVNGSERFIIIKDTAKSSQYVRSGDIKFENKDFEGAVNDYNKAIEFNSENWLAYQGMGYAKHELHKYNEAVQDFSKALNINAKDIISYRGRANSKEFNGNYQGAIDDYTIAINLSKPKINYGSFLGRAYCYYRLKKYQESIDDYTVYISQYPNFSGAYFNRGNAYLYYGDFEKAIEDYSRHLSFKDSYPMAYHQRGLTYLQLSKPDYAIFDLRMFLKQQPPQAGIKYNYADVYFQLATAYSIKDDSINARVYFKKIFQTDSNYYNNSPVVFAEWAKSEYNWGCYQKSIELSKKAISKVTKSAPAKPDYYYTLAIAQLCVKDTLPALENLKNAIELDINYYPAYEIRVSILASKYPYKTQNVQDLTKMISLVKGNKDKAKLYAVRAYVKSQNKEFSGAKEDIDKAIELNPNDPFYYINRAFYFMQILGDTYNDSHKSYVLKELDKAISINDTIWQPYMVKAATLSYFGDQKDACDNLYKAQKYGLKLTDEVINVTCKSKITKKMITTGIFVADMKRSYEDTWPVKPELVVSGNVSDDYLLEQK